nr:transposase (putative), gypsy type [Tanacetum cinerariifolium]
DQMVEQRCAEMDAHLDAMSIDFDEDLYPHMLIAIAGRRWVIGNGLRLATMKCAESLEMRQAFADVVSAGIAKGMSEGLKHGVEHGHAQRTIESLEAYDPEAEAKLTAALQSLKDLKLPLLDQLEGLKDAPMDVIMASLYLEDDTGGDAPQFIPDLHPSSSQLAIPVYPEVRDPRNPWACTEEIKLVDAIAAKINRAEQKKRSRIVCRTHGVGSAHHARSDRVPVSAPIVVPQGLALILVDATTQTDPDA